MEAIKQEFDMKYAPCRRCENRYKGAFVILIAV